MEDQKVLMETYFHTRDTARRYEMLKRLVLDLPEDGKDFFLRACKKERYLDMRLAAVRGYAAFADEAEVAAVMEKLLKILKKRPETAPYDYQEYEMLRSAFLMPFLLKTYAYPCFKAFDEQLERQYRALPEAFKGLFTLDENGRHVPLVEPEEAKRRIDGFWAAQ